MALEHAYDYKGKTILKLDYNNELLKYNNVNVFGYTINTITKYPFQQILLVKSINTQEFVFPTISLFNNFNKYELIDYTKVCLFDLLMSENYELFNDLIKFVGFFERNNNLYLFFDLTENKIQLHNNSTVQFALIDEIVNHKNICNVTINEFVVQLFQKNQDLCFLIDDTNLTYDIPIVGFTSKPDTRLNYTYIFGQTKCNKNEILGPYYYFESYNDAFTKVNQMEKMGLVRFAIFTGNMKYIENFPNDQIDESEIKQQRLQDDKLNQNLERLTMRISDHDGKWAYKYDSVYLGNVKLDDDSFLNKQKIVVKEYAQQIPLSIHIV